MGCQEEVMERGEWLMPTLNVSLKSFRPLLRARLITATDLYTFRSGLLQVVRIWIHPLHRRRMCTQKCWRSVLISNTPFSRNGDIPCGTSIGESQGSWMQ